MKSQLEEVSSVARKLKISVPVEEVQSARQTALEKIRKKANIKGFRKGKAPLTIIEKQYAWEVDRDAVDALVQKTYPLALAEAKVVPISQPRIEPESFSHDQEFVYSAHFEVQPVFEVKGYKGLKLEREKIEIAAEEIDGELKRMQDAMTQLEPVEDPEAALQVGQIGKIDFTGTIDGEVFEGNQAKDYLMDVGAGNLIKEFEEQIVGMKKGETRTVSFKYPQDYFNKEMAGKVAEYQVTLHEIRKKNVPELNDEFAKDLGNFETLKEVKADIENNLRAHKEEHQKNGLYDQLLAQLSEKNEFDVPESMVEAELKRMLEGMARQMQQQGASLENLNIEKMMEQYRPAAVANTKGFLLLENICRQEEFQVSDEEVETYLAKQAKEINQPVEKVKAYYQKNQLMSGLQLRLMHEKALEFVLSQAKIKEVKPKKKG